jgi:hypothetical protein
LLFQGLSELIALHRSMATALEAHVTPSGGAARGSPPPRMASLLLSYAAQLGELYVSYAANWSSAASHELRALESSDVHAALAPPRLRHLLELPLERTSTYETLAVELQLMTQPKDPCWGTVVRLLETLTVVAQRVGAQQSELLRHTQLRDVVAKFKPGEVDELLDSRAPHRVLLHSGVISKASKMGRLVRHYFLFDDGRILTGEQIRSVPATNLCRP